MEEKDEIKTCGIIMPIAEMTGGYSENHWKEVKSIIKEAAEDTTYEFKTEIVSDSGGKIDVIHKTIIENIYTSDIVVCDMSGRNPNVLFELGMRLTFDKPTIIIKDDATDFIFDTGVIKHIQYPKDLRFHDIKEFQEELSEGIEKTYTESINNPDYSTFLGNFDFKEFKPSLKQETISDANEMILHEIKEIRNELSSIKREAATTKKFEYQELTKFQKKKKRIPYFPELKRVVKNYITDTRDNDAAKVIIHKQEFIDYLSQNRISPINHRQYINVLEEYVLEAREDREVEVL